MARRDETYILYTFNSPHSAIKTQKLLSEFSPKVIPILRELSENCGMSVKLKLEFLEVSLEVMNSSNIPKWSLYKIAISNGQTVIEKIK